MQTRPLEEQQQHQILETIFSRPLTPAGYLDAPPLHLPTNIAVNISEEKDQGAAWQVTYRGLVGTGRADLGVLEQKAPLWLMDFLLGNRVLTREPVKIVSFGWTRFSGEHVRGCSCRLSCEPVIPDPVMARSRRAEPFAGPAKRVSLHRTGGVAPPSAALTRFVSHRRNARLTANRNLRLKKVCHYVADKLGLHGASTADAAGANHRHSGVPSIAGSSDGQSTKSSQSARGSAAGGSDGAGSSSGVGQAVASLSSASSSVVDGFDPEDELEVLVGDVVLPLGMTLAAARTYYWKQGGDLVVQYRPKVKLVHGGVVGVDEQDEEEE